MVLQVYPELTNQLQLVMAIAQVRMDALTTTVVAQIVPHKKPNRRKKLKNRKTEV